MIQDKKKKPVFYSIKNILAGSTHVVKDLCCELVVRIYFTKTTMMYKKLSAY